MKIEKISENKIKIELYKSDLEERGLKISELAYGSEKASELFHDLLEKAMTEHDFTVGNTPIMIEAVPLSLESIRIIVTKIDRKEEFEKKLELSMQNDLFSLKDIENLKTTLDENDKVETKRKSNKISIFSFDDFNNIILISKRINGIFSGKSILYKDNSKYYLLLESNPSKSTSILNINKIESVLYEYGEKHVSNEVSKLYLSEHFEVIIKDYAIDKLATNF